MRVKKKSNYNPSRQLSKDYVSDIDSDVKGLVRAMQGRVRFGDGTSGTAGENISGEFSNIAFGVANTEIEITHSVGSVPVGVLVMYQDRAGSIYGGPATIGSVTAWTSSKIYLKCDTASLEAKIFIIR